MKERAERILRETGIIAIARGISPDLAPALAGALLDGGIRMMEVTMNTPGADGIIRALREEYGDRMVIGAGTVTDAALLDRAVRAGAGFIVTPNLDEAVVRRCIAEGLLVTPGVMTPTEACRAMALGCRYLKLFPAAPLGPAYLKAILAPLDRARILVVGGIGSANLADYLRAGAFGAGVGGSLCRMTSADERDAVTARAAALTGIRRAWLRKNAEP